MATAKIALRKMREICLALPNAREGHHFGKTAFYAKSKLFATCEDKEDGPCEITFGLEPERAAALVESDPRFKPYPRDKRGVVLDAAQVKDWSEVKALILQSYELVNQPRVSTRRKQATPRKRVR